MNEALCSILSTEGKWIFDSEGRSLTFNKDGTGELWCSCSFNYWIGAELKWKSIKPLDPVEPQSHTVEIASTAMNKSPHVLGQLNLEITLAKDIPLWARGSSISTSTVINKGSLTDDAFQPKLFNIRIEKGNFKQPSHVGVKDSDWCAGWSRYTLRLVFDQSPYPPRAEWREPEKGPDDSQFWDHKEFVGRKSPEMDRVVRAMNEPSSAGWDTCTVS